MKVLHREDVEEAGYDMPNSGICANIPEFDLEELKFAGEWVLADDEVVVSDGRQQEFLYMVASGQVDVHKRTDQSSQHQHIATIAAGEAFGEMAFLSGGVAAADVQATGQAVLWRIDHERLLEFVGQHRAGGQLCMNIASTLSNRLVNGNRQLVDLGKKLQDSMHQLRSVSQADAGKNKALRQMQNRVTGVTKAFQGQEVAKTKLGGLGIAAMVATGILLISLIISLATRPDAAAEDEAVSLQKQLDELTSEHVVLVVKHKDLRGNNDELKQQFAEASREHRKELIAALQTTGESPRPTDGLPENPALPTPPLVPPDSPSVVEVPPEKPPEPIPVPSVTPEVPDNDPATVLAWARRWSTMAFPIQVTVLRPFSLQASAGSGAGIPMSPGKSLYALRITGDKLQVGLKPASNTFTQMVPVDATTFVESVTPSFRAHVKRLKQGREDTPPTTEGTPFPAPPTPPGSDGVKNPSPKPDNDHGRACVCKECREKKKGKGGSLFQFEDE